MNLPKLKSETPSKQLIFLKFIEIRKVLLNLKRKYVSHDEDTNYNEMTSEKGQKK